MTTLIDLDFLTLFETVQDARALEVAQRLIQGEVVFHEARLGQLKELDKALGNRVKELRKGGGAQPRTAK